MVMSFFCRQLCFKASSNISFGIRHDKSLKNETIADLKESLLNELKNAQSTLKTEHQIFDLWKGTKRFFCTYSFYVDYLDLKEFKALVNECKDMNERDLIF
jgi:hypothetical protein